MSRRLTPDPLQVDPWTNPVRISLPIGIKFIVIREDVTPAHNNLQPIEVGTECDATPPLTDFVYVSHTSDFGPRSPSGPRVVEARRSDLGVGTDAEEEAEGWFSVAGDFQDFEAQDWSVFDVDAYTSTFDCDPAAGIEATSNLIISLEGGEIISYLDFFRSSSGQFIQEPVRDVETTATVRTITPPKFGALTRNGNELCCSNLELGPKLFGSTLDRNEQIKEEQAFNYAEGRNKIKVSTGEQFIDATLVGVSVIGIRQFYWVYAINERVDLSQFKTIAS